MPTWKIAAVQMDCRIGEVEHNLQTMRAELRRAAQAGARLVIFPECALTGYGFDSLDEALPFGQALPGAASEALGADCKELGTFVVAGLLERTADDSLFNAALLVGPDGPIASYRKVHLPFLGVDRFTTPGDRPFAVHDLGGLRVGLNICYDGSFPEAARTLTLLGADLVVLPTNWPTGAASVACLLTQARALENHVYYAAVNRIGEERGFRFIGQSRLVGCGGELLAPVAGDGPELLLADIDPARARTKRLVHVSGKYEIDRVADRRPEMYAPLCEPKQRG